MLTKEFYFDLPADLIATYPTAQRTESRLLYLNAQRELIDSYFRQLPDFLATGDVLILNDTRVLKARLVGTKASGGKATVLIEKSMGTHTAAAFIQASNAPPPGMVIHFSGSYTATVLLRHDDLFELEFNAPVIEVMQACGVMPLPPYITRGPEALDDERYQTVYARVPGAVAAPTAGLHFDESMLKRLENQGVRVGYVTLHVGAGTFFPVREETIEAHRMHKEMYNIPPSTVALIKKARSENKKIIAVGTTSLRALEAAAQTGELHAGSGETDIYITPGFRFRVVQRLITNFHLPESTLLMLVSAFAGVEPIRRAYRHAIEARYRFFSYGDAMLIDRAAEF